MAKDTNRANHSARSHHLAFSPRPKPRHVSIMPDENGIFQDGSRNCSRRRLPFSPASQWW
ncbi:MAG: hypothetical protein IMZ46_18315 [Acidobacteria bacterium]|nr:hypothetical protein [Acidobacteriota bacterium]